ncbi:MAG: GFA family protein [Gammaproteobacteria bacterium]|nr:GFA family protein [Gammaproteobacteria bacterium]
MMNLRGECLCGGVKYEYNGETGPVINCHCNECRKWHGSAYRTRTVGKKANFSWLSGEENVAFYDRLPNVIKTFCKICGSNLISLYKDNEGFIGLPLGAVEIVDSMKKAEQIELLKPSYHVYVDYKADWHDITDNLPQYKELPDEISSIHKLKQD